MYIRRRRWLLPVVSLLGVLVVAGAVVGLVQYLVHATDRTLTLAQTVASVTVPATAVAAVLWRWGWRRTSGEATPVSLAAVADELARVVKSQWEKAALERRLLYPAPIPLQ
jgi:hypothetical protein